jgi:CheY-like chemotaxis protein
VTGTLQPCLAGTDLEQRYSHPVDGWLAPPDDSPGARRQALLRGVSGSLAVAALLMALAASTPSQGISHLGFAVFAAAGFLAGEVRWTRTGSALTSCAPLIVPWAGFLQFTEGQGGVEATWLALATTLGVLLLPLQAGVAWGVLVPVISGMLMLLAGIPSHVAAPVAGACLVVGISTSTVGYSLALRDRMQSEHRALTAAYRENIEQSLKQSQRSQEAKDRFLAVLTHDLRTPLTGVLGGARLLADAPLTPEQHRTAQIIDESGKAMLTVIDDLLDISRIESGETVVNCSAVAPLQLLIEQIRAVSTTGRSVVPLLYVGPARLPTVNADRHRLGQVLAHLLSSAAASTHTGQILVDAKVEGRRLGIVVTDRNPVPHGSDASFTTPPGGTGVPGHEAGIGLSIARGLVEAMDGSLEVCYERGRTGEATAWLQIYGQADAETQTGDGLSALIIHPVLAQRAAMVRWLEGWGYGVVAAGDARSAMQSLGSRTFDVVLVSDSLGTELAGVLPSHRIWLGREEVRPGESALDTPLNPSEVRGALLEDLLVEPEDDEVSDFGASIHQARILLAEDNPTNRTVLRAMLGNLGCRVQVVGNGVQALDAVAGDQFDLVLMDCHMPDMDGFEATRAILESGADVPVVALTASAGFDVERRCVDAGMSTYLTKPVSLDRLRKEIQRHCVL